jgi:hypothetical protein
MNILKFVQDYLETKRGHWPEIAAEAGVTYSWLTKVVQNTIPNPGIKDLQKLLDYIVAHGGIIKAIY